MLKHLFFILSLVFSGQFIFGQDTLSTNIYFGVDLDKASLVEYQKLDEILSKEPRIRTILLKGHTDSDGSHEYNKALSMRRTRAVERYLKKHVDVPIQTDFYGEDKPIRPNNDDRGKTKNRRVKVTFIYEPITDQKSITMQDVYNELSVPNQIIRIRTDQDTVLTLQQGTVIKINANTFETPTNYALLEAKEVYSYVDMVGERLSTTSNGQQLETGGMIKLIATDESNQEIKPMKKLTFFVPTDKPKEDMKLFYGERDPHHAMNWQLAEDSSGANSSLSFLPESFFANTGMIPPIQEPEECKFFFCKIRRGIREFSYLFVKNDRTGTPGYIGGAEYNDSIQQMMDSLGVDTYNELQAELRKRRVEQGEASTDDVGLYAFSTSKMGWINCDRFTSMRPLITMRSKITRRDDKFTSLVFKNLKSIFPARLTGGTYSFVNVPKGEPVYHVVMYTKKDKVLLSIVDTTIANSTPEEQFEEVELGSLRNRLSQLEN